jgi:predicted O-methyltransferase YrrM
MNCTTEPHCLKLKGDDGQRVMDNRIQKVTESFIMDLTGADAALSQEYFAEIRHNQEFYNRSEENRRVFGKRRYSSWNYGIGIMLGAVLYIVCRRQKPDIVVETGVASGVSSSHILCALEKNKRGQLYSIDLPSWQESQSGWIIPDYLRHRWHLTLGRSSETLEPLLRKVANIDIFLHDSDHSYQNMLWEFQTAWTYLKSGGLLFSHNIDYNNAFSDFCRDHGIRGYALGDMGGVMKT